MRGELRPQRDASMHVHASTKSSESVANGSFPVLARHSETFTRSIRVDVSCHRDIFTLFVQTHRHLLFSFCLSFNSVYVRVSLWQRRDSTVLLIVSEAEQSTFEEKRMIRVGSRVSKIA